MKEQDVVVSPAGPTATIKHGIDLCLFVLRTAGVSKTMLRIRGGVERLMTIRVTAAPRLK